MQNFNVHGRMVAENDRPGVVSRGGLILIQLWVCSGERRGGVGSTSGERRILRGGDESPQKKNDRTKKINFIGPERITRLRETDNRINQLKRRDDTGARRPLRFLPSERAPLSNYFLLKVVETHHPTMAR